MLTDSRQIYLNNFNLLYR